MVKNIYVGGKPLFIDRSGDAVSEDAVYVANTGSDTISVVDPFTNTVVENITTVAVYVANVDSNTISVIDPQSNTVVENITNVGEGPRFIETLGDYIYVANSDSNTVSVIDSTTYTVVKNISTVGEPGFISINTGISGVTYT